MGLSACLVSQLGLIRRLRSNEPSEGSSVKNSGLFSIFLGIRVRVKQQLLLVQLADADEGYRKKEREDAPPGRRGRVESSRVESGFVEMPSEI